MARRATPSRVMAGTVLAAVFWAGFAGRAEERVLFDFEGEAVANGIEYAEGKFWREICGEYWCGDDPDLLPLVIAYGQAGCDLSVFDFAEAVRFWTSGEHPNHGFTMSSFGNYMELCSVWTRHAPQIQRRPALVVVYEPPE